MGLNWEREERRRQLFMEVTAAYTKAMADARSNYDDVDWRVIQQSFEQVVRVCDIPLPLQNKDGTEWLTVPGVALG